MPRHNPALGMFFTGPKGQEYLQEFEGEHHNSTFLWISDFQVNSIIKGT